jgi:hypothetical protein
MGNHNGPTMFYLKDLTWLSISIRCFSFLFNNTIYKLTTKSQNKILDYGFYYNITLIAKIYKSF